jgi:hypothetical protein
LKFIEASTKPNSLTALSADRAMLKASITVSIPEN